MPRAVQSVPGLLQPNWPEAAKVPVKESYPE